MATKLADLRTRFIPGKCGNARESVASSRSRDKSQVKRTENKEKLKVIVNPAVVGTESIRWEAKRGMFYVTANCARLRRILERRMRNPLFGYSRLYKVMLDGLPDPKSAWSIRLRVTAAGFSPGQRKREEQSAFIKLEAEGEGIDFILPRSFLKDCKAAFMSRNFRWR